MIRLTERHRQEFAERGFTHLTGVIPPQWYRRTDAAIQALYERGPQHDGIRGSPMDPEVVKLIGQPNLERIAQHILECDAVVLNSAAILFKRPDPPDTPFQFKGEHVDVMYSLAEWEARPRVMLCMIMVLLADLPLGRANTWLRPGSHRQLARWLADNSQPPIREKPTHVKDLPALPWAPPVPAVGHAGEAYAFNTNVLHCGSPNLDSKARRIMFINFCPRGKLEQCSGNYDRRAERAAWRAFVKQQLPPSRQHLVREDGE